MKLNSYQEAGSFDFLFLIKYKGLGIEEYLNLYEEFEVIT